MVCGVRLIIHARILQVHVFVCMFCNLLDQSDTTKQAADVWLVQFNQMSICSIICKASYLKFVINCVCLEN
jgi:hypothetical protein